MDSTASPSRTFAIGDTTVNTSNVSSTRLTMPECLSSYQPQTTEDSVSNKHDKTIYIVLQHSKSAGNSALLPFSNIVGVFTTRLSAKNYMRKLQEHKRPLIRLGIWEAESSTSWRNFWCMGDGDEGEDGFTFRSEGGEEYVVWIEEHAICEGEEGEAGNFENRAT